MDNAFASGARITGRPAPWSALETRPMWTEWVATAPCVELPRRASCSAKTKRPRRSSRFAAA